MSADVQTMPNGFPLGNVSENGKGDMVHRSEKETSSKDGGKHKHKDKKKDKHKDKEHKHKDKKKDKHKDKKKDKHKDKEREKDKSRDDRKSRDKEKDKHKDKEGRKSEKDKENKDAAKLGTPGVTALKTEVKEEAKLETPDVFSRKSEVKEEQESGFGSALTKSEVNDSQVDNDASIEESLNEADESMGSDEEVGRSKRGKKSTMFTDDEDEDEEEAQEEEEEEEEEEYTPKKPGRKSQQSSSKKSEKSSGKKRKSKKDDDEDEDDFKPTPAKKARTSTAKKGKGKAEKEDKAEPESPKKGRKKKAEEEEQHVWKWWEEEKKDDGVKWKFLEHKGPVFAPLYEPLPDNVKFYYDGKEMKLSPDSEEVATFYAKMLTHEYTTKEAFNENFFKDWRKSMTEKEKDKIKDLKKCDFTKMNEYFVQKSEERKNWTKEQKKALKEENEKIAAEYGFCTIDGHKEKIGNFKVEPPSLFRGRGEHPKMGKVKRRIQPEDVIINCSKDSKIPVPPDGHKWKEVRHDNTVTWLCSWTENIQGQIKYIMLNPSSKLKGEKDWQKYETARKLHKIIDRIREDYWADMKSKEMKTRQRAVAVYLIDKLALRAGNEKEEGETADTVGCCSLRVEHITLHEHKDGKDHVIAFDFLGKDSIRYQNEVAVEKRVFKNLQLFMENKSPGDDLFDRLNTAILNKHLTSIMDGLTAKVFRTYNASRTLQEQLDKLTDPNDNVAGLLLSYNRANRAVAVLCNHQRAVPKSHAKSMEALQAKIKAKEEAIAEAEKEVKAAKKDLKESKSERNKMQLEKKQKALEKHKEALMKLNVQATSREENKDIALGTSKLNYLDPRITVAWCKKYNVPIEKVYSKTHKMKFRWAIDMATADFKF